VHGIGCIFFPQTQPIYKSTGTAVKKIMEKKRKLKRTEILLLTLCPNHIHQKIMKKKYWNHQITSVKEDFLHVIIPTPFQSLLLTFQCNSHSETDMM